MTSLTKEKYILSHVADKNVYGFTFGGIIMREGYELGYITAYLLSNKEHP